jgi:secreted trypsin-like serine protease
MRVDRVVLHPGYDPETQQHDLALVRLDQIAGPLIAQAAGPADDPDEATALGFGSLFEGSLAGRALTSTGAPAALVSDRLQKVRLSFVHPAECAQVGGSREMWMGLCMTAAPADACVGDSGGPLIVEDNAGTDRLLGVLSSGSGCAVDRPRIAYTRVAPYARWIVATITAD